MRAWRMKIEIIIVIWRQFDGSCCRQIFQ